MLRTLWNSKSAMIANQEKLDSISNNLANANTDGYKRITVSFQDLMSETLNRKGVPISDNEERSQDPFTGTGVKTAAWVRDNRQGILQETNKNTDFAIDGEGYFQVTKADGSVAYTRAGRFDVDANNKLVDSNGNRVSIIFNPGVDEASINFTADNFSITEGGEILLKDEQGYNVVGRLPIYTSTGSDAFRSDGENYYAANPGANIVETNQASVYQGYIEGSNVDLVTEMTEMIVTQRAFQLGSKGLETADEMWRIANNIRK
ncbi:flagellar hook-basal body complex protein [Clostridium thermarum]|uniref:flagellar hook-basal body complex protein n=1 Tax=Clostridium thermarum TaxID=1716543 RepID=UPI0013D3D187|nr:flagellar hook-basal body complex protein [Clostridium thermarum]